jgi:hypothetical protein
MKEASTMERLETIEHLIEAGREEGPRIVAERSREAVEAVEAGVAAALASARDRLRPEPKRPGVARIVLIGFGTAIALAILGVVIAVAVERVQRWMRAQRRGRFDPLVREAERASDALELDPSREEESGVTAGQPRVSIPVDASVPGSGDGVNVGGEVSEGVASR